MTRTVWVCLVAYVYMLAILLYSVIGRIRAMTSHLGVANEGDDTVYRACDCVHDGSVKVWFPGEPGGDICARLCVYVFRYVQIVLYDVGGCHMDVIIHPEEVD